MNERVRRLVEIVGIFGVIASLLFVGLQLVLDRRVAMGAQFHERSIMGIEDYRMKFDNDIWVTSLAKQYEKGFKPSWWNEEIDDLQNTREYTTEEMVRLILNTQMYLARINNNYVQYTLGLYPEEAWLRNLETIRNATQQNPLTRVIGLSSPSLEANLVQYMQQAVNDLPATN